MPKNAERSQENVQEPRDNDSGKRKLTPMKYEVNTSIDYTPVVELKSSHNRE